MDKCCGNCSHFKDESITGYGNCYMGVDNAKCDSGCEDWHLASLRELRKLLMKPSMADILTEEQEETE